MKKKNVFYGIIMLFCAFLFASCGPETPAPKPLGDGNLTAYAQLDKATKTFLWGVRETKSGTPKIKAVFTKPPVTMGEFFISTAKDYAIVFDNSGTILMTGDHIALQTSEIDSTACYLSTETDDGLKVYLIKDKKTIGPKPQILVDAKVAYYQNEDSCGILTPDNKDLLPQGIKELYVITEAKKKGKETVETTYYLANEGKVWNLYKDDGSKLKKIAPAQQKKLINGAIQSSLGKIFFNIVKSI